MHLIFRYILIFFIICYISEINAYADSLKIQTQVSEKNADSVVDYFTNKCWKLREKNSDSALYYGKEALKIATKYNLTTHIPKINGFIGVIYIHYLYDIKSSIPHFHKSLEGSLQNNDSIRIAYSYNNLGDAFMLTGNIPLALQYSKNSLNIFKKINYLPGIAYGYINLGLIYREEKKYNQAIQNFNNALKIREQLGDSTGHASAILELARTYQEKGNLNLAMEHYLHSYGHHVEINNSSYTAYCLNGIADIHYMRNKFDEAFENYTKAVELNKSESHYYGLIDDYIGLALVYAKQNKIIDGEIALNNALDISTNLGLHSRTLDIYETFANFYQILNDYEKSLESFSNFLIIYDSILSLQQYEILNEIQENFEVRQNLNIANQELASKRMEEQYLIIIILLMIVLITVIIWRYIAKRNLNLKLTTANKTKDKLFSIISHDLRSPFNSLLGFSELLVDDLNIKECQNALEYAKAIQTTSNDTLILLNNLLTWSRTQSGRIEFNPDTFLISDLFEDLSLFYKNETTINNINLSFNNSAKNKISGDQTIIKIILSNLISNAIKYTNPGGKIAVDASQKQNKIKFTIEDTGIGIHYDKLKSILKSNKNIDSTVGVRNEKGTGIGLVICMDLVKIHNGTITAESEPNNGSTFIVELPIPE